MRFTILFLAYVSILSCSREELTIEDRIELGEYEDNFMVAKPEAVSIESLDLILEYKFDEITLQKTDETNTLNIGNYLIKRPTQIDDTIVFLSKIVDLTVLQDEIKIRTEVASLDEVFTSINYDSRKSKAPVLVSRSFFSENVKIEASDIPAKPTLFIDTAVPDYDFNYESDSVRVIIVKDEATNKTLSKNVNIYGIKMDGHFCVNLKGKIRWGFKTNIIPKPIPIAAFPNIFTAVYIDPQFEAYMALKGRVKSPRVQFETNKFDMSLSFGANGEINSSNIFPVTPTFTANSTGFDYGGSVEVTAFGGVLVYASNIAPDRDFQLLRAGVKIGLKNATTIAKNKTFIPVNSQYEVSTSSSLGAKLFADVKLFSIPWSGSKLKVGLEWQSDDLDFELYNLNVPLSSVSCSKIDEIVFTPSLGQFNIRVNGVGASISDRYNVFLNDSIVLNTSGEPLQLEYNKQQNFSTGIPQFTMNGIDIMDVQENACFYSDSYAQTDAFNPDNCSNTFQDPRNNSADTYCTTVIGDQVWMQQNLRYEGTPSDPLGTWKEGELSPENVVLGRYYTYDEALNGEPRNSTSGGITSTRQIQGVCPDGWHLPSTEEFETLVANVGGAQQAISRLKMPSSFYWPNSNLSSTPSTFNAVAAGSYINEDLIYVEGTINKFSGFQQDAMFWTSSVTPNVLGAKDVGNIFIISEKRISGGQGSSGIGQILSIDRVGASVRCIQD